MKRYAWIYIMISAALFFYLVLFFNIAERGDYSETERRELKAFPEFTGQSYADGSFFSGIGEWYSDTVPMRDTFTRAALAAESLKGIRLKTGEEEISFHGVNALAGDGQGTAGLMPDDGNNPVSEGINADQEEAYQQAEAGPDLQTGSGNTASASADTAGGEAPGEESTDFTVSEDNTVQAPLPAHSNDTIADNVTPISEDFTNAANGIIVTGSGENTRAIMMYGGSSDVTKRYAECANHYKEVMPQLNVFVMVIPTSVAFYCPEGALAYTGSQLKQINNVQVNLRDDVYGIDVYTILGEHRDEPIYLRTDHHWAPLGAYYAASKLAEAAGLPFLDISEYDENVVHGYVGSMYTYAKDIRISSNPEDFVYYVPKDVTLKTTYTEYTLDSKWNVTGEKEPHEGQFFIKYPDGSGGAYCTFMGGDAKITRVETSTKNGRKLLILKDSYGNALPAFLFGSYEEVHVVDSRYFTRNICTYIEEYGITDLLFANNAFHASVGSTINAYERYLTQGKEDE